MDDGQEEPEAHDAFEAPSPIQVTVVDIHEHRTPRAKYPRVVAETGKASEQYPQVD
ncbi:MAG TPA: hypothetical protein VK539_09355 [Myxococcaceae bacterium]|nr:hypothetical protein [Myxococcaceae bacterium]